MLGKELKYCQLEKSWASDIPSNYQPISLTPAISKVYEAVFGNAIDSFTKKHDIILE